MLFTYRILPIMLRILRSTIPETQKGLLDIMGCTRGSDQDDINEFWQIVTTKQRLNRAWRLSHILTDQEIQTIIFQDPFPKQQFYCPMLHEYVDVTMGKSKQKAISETCAVLLRYIGVERFLSLMVVYGGHTITIPTEKEFLEYVRDKAVFHRHGEKTSVQKIAIEFRLSIEQVRRIIKRQTQLQEKTEEFRRKHLELLKAVSGTSDSERAQYFRYYKSLLGDLIYDDS